ncbi:hypothetical protein B0H17DRAFT_1256889 [Mycena rosella]|uniref:Uncharacterized protein n=1 Tax=Mycena rosella TaxID=1033263 RepID=A0AAD7DW51_MYCRO|nr:hypothetical protein B0H17DRAFT_1256889 [Mycena rosella]
MERRPQLRAFGGIHAEESTGPRLRAFGGIQGEESTGHNEVACTAASAFLSPRTPKDDESWKRISLRPDPTSCAYALSSPSAAEHDGRLRTSTGVVAIDADSGSVIHGRLRVPVGQRCDAACTHSQLTVGDLMGIFLAAIYQLGIKPRPILTGARRSRKDADQPSDGYKEEFQLHQEVSAANSGVARNCIVWSVAQVKLSYAETALEIPLLQNPIQCQVLKAHLRKSILHHWKSSLEYREIQSSVGGTLRSHHAKIKTDSDQRHSAMRRALSVTVPEDIDVGQRGMHDLVLELTRGSGRLCSPRHYPALELTAPSLIRMELARI